MFLLANEWYDRQREPFRFLVFFVPCSVLIMGASYGPIETRLACLCLLAFAGLARAIYLRGR